MLDGDASIFSSVLPDSSGFTLIASDPKKTKDEDLSWEVKARVFDMTLVEDLADYQMIKSKIYNSNGRYLQGYENIHWTKSDKCLNCMCWAEAVTDELY